jgi:DNA-directed RNA polymerase specialized sigma24 family protein
MANTYQADQSDQPTELLYTDYLVNNHRKAELVTIVANVSAQLRYRLRPRLRSGEEPEKYAHWALIKWHEDTIPLVRPVAWLVVTAICIRRSMYRRWGARVRLTDPVDLLEPASEDGSIDRADAREWAACHMGALPHEEWRPVLLAWMDGQRGAALAKAARCSQTTARKRLAAA